MTPPDHTLRPVVYPRPPSPPPAITASADASAAVLLIGQLDLDPGLGTEACFLDDDHTAHWKLRGGIEVTCRTSEATGGAHWHIGTW
jgi:hypothetical protein